MGFQATAVSRSDARAAEPFLARPLHGLRAGIIVNVVVWRFTSVRQLFTNGVCASQIIARSKERSRQ
jgi:hypothetical protein